MNRTRRGNATTTIAAMIPMLGFVALVVDVGVLQTGHSELQVATDAAALAGTGFLDGTSSGIEAARKEATDVGALNTVLGQPLLLGSHEIITGRFDRETSKFVPETDPAKVHAVQVKSDATRFDTFFAGAAFGKQFTETEAMSVAAITPHDGVGRTSCYLPIAIPDCFLTDMRQQAYTFKMTSAQNDNAGWAEIGGHPTASTIVEQLRGNCAGGTASVGDIVGLNSGQVASALQEVDTQIESSPTSWNTGELGALPAKMPGSSVGNYGRVIEGQIIVFHPAGGVCGSMTQFNQSAPITGFAWAVVYDVKTAGTTKDIRVRLDLDYTHGGGTAGGGLASNLTWDTVELVR